MRCPDALWILGLVLIAGCGRSGGLDAKVVHGTVTVAGEKVDAGEVRFVPIEGTPGPTSAATILDGQYRIEARGGVPVGKHRVEVEARRKTGRQVQQHNGFEMTLVDETVRVGAAEYATDRSPLAREITPDADGRIDLEIPAN